MIGGVVVDGAGAPVPDAMIETWQCRRAASRRCATDADGRWDDAHDHDPPGVATRDGTTQAPAPRVSVFARGLLDRVVTRVYFGDERAAANAADPTLSTLGSRPPPAAPASPRAPAPATGRYRLDIRPPG